MRTIETKVYKFEELSDDAKQKAIEWWKEGETFDWIIEEAWDTVQIFAEVFNIRMHSMDFLEHYRSEYSFGNIDDNILELTGHRLATYIWNNYKNDIYKGKYYGKLVDTDKDGTPLQVSKEHPIGKRHVLRYSRCQLSRDCVFTGVCYDMDILDPIYDFLDHPNYGVTFKELLESCLSSVAKSVQGEIEANLEDDAISDTIIANDYEFNEDGSKY